MMLLMSITWLLIKGTGIWGVNVPVGWGFAIINFVWWIGIGHAGTLISAILLLLKQDWRTSINRFAEAMTLFAVACAGIFPLIHTGRPWLAAYWLLPYPNTMGIWPQFRSPLIWDVFAVSTYLTVSLLFWYVGLVPDLATLRDRAKTLHIRRLFGMLALGWRGSARHWERYEAAYLLLAGLSTPLVLSVHTVVSFDFSIGIIPGWHATIFPPYFVAGAIYAGFAMVLTLAIPLRILYNLQDFLTMRHLENMGKVMLVTGLIVGYGYVMEAFFGWYSANQYEEYMILNRMTGPYWPFYWTLILCNILMPQFLWIKSVRTLADQAVPHLDGRQRRHVARAVRHRRHEPAPRLPALVMGHVLADAVGLDDVFRDHRAVRHAVLPVHPGAADDLDLRDADGRARRQGEGRQSALSACGAMDHTPAGSTLYGVMAEFEDPTALVEAARRTYDEGYRRFDSFSPFPIHEIFSAMHLQDGGCRGWSSAAGSRACWRDSGSRCGCRRSRIR